MLLGRHSWITERDADLWQPVTLGAHGAGLRTADASASMGLPRPLGRQNSGDPAAADLLAREAGGEGLPPRALLSLLLSVLSSGHSHA